MGTDDNASWSPEDNVSWGPEDYVSWSPEDKVLWALKTIYPGAQKTMSHGVHDVSWGLTKNSQSTTILFTQYDMTDIQIRYIFTTSSLNTKNKLHHYQSGVRCEQQTFSINYIQKPGKSVAERWPLVWMYLLPFQNLGNIVHPAVPMLSFGRDQKSLGP